MARLILKCPYLKGRSEKTSAHLENLVNYIATRDGVDRIVDELVKDEMCNEVLHSSMDKLPETLRLSQ